VRVFYTIMGDQKERAETRKALDRATPFLRRQLGARIRLRRVPELQFTFDETIEHQDRIERILLDLQREREANAAANPEPGTEHPEPGTGNQHPEPGTRNPEPETDPGPRTQDDADPEDDE